MRFPVPKADWSKHNKSRWKISNPAQLLQHRGCESSPSWKETPELLCKRKGKLSKNKSSVQSSNNQRGRRRKKVLTAECRSKMQAACGQMGLVVSGLPCVDLQFGRTWISSPLVNVGMERANPASYIWLKGNETENGSWKGGCCNVLHFIVVQLPLNSSWLFAHNWQQHPEEKKKRQNNPKIKRLLWNYRAIMAKCSSSFSPCHVKVLTLTAAVSLAAAHCHMSHYHCKLLPPAWFL